jgi:SAM-dependent methyltransferase
MTPKERWLAAMWPFVRAWLPSAPARVLEIGCGPLGGFVPALLGAGYDAFGVDPEAPDAPNYHRVEFGRYRPPRPVDCVVACTSLHHVGNLDVVLDQVAASLVPDGPVVVEWAWERFDEATARWCFDRRLHVVGPYFFADLLDISEPDEQAAIDAGQIQATGIRYAGRRL